MKEVNVTTIPVGTRFTYMGMKFEVIDRSEYPFVSARRIGLNPATTYGPTNFLFTNFEKVMVADKTKIYKQTFVDDGKHGFVMKEELV